MGRVAIREWAVIPESDDAVTTRGGNVSRMLSVVVLNVEVNANVSGIYIVIVETEVDVVVVLLLLVSGGKR